MSSGSPEDLEPPKAPDSDSSKFTARREKELAAAKHAGQVLKDGTDSGTCASPSAKHSIGVVPPHPRDGLQPWRWPMMLFGNLVLTVIGGYDTSNAANVQVPIYQAFGHIELLPWIGLTYSMVSVAMIPLARKLTGIFEIRALSVASALLVIAGSALAGAAPNISSVIVGRAIMGVGSVILYQVILTWNVIFSKPHELPLVQAVVGAVYAVGLISGPVVGGAFAENEHATWRWAFYVVIPFTAVSVLLMVFYPTFRLPSSKSTLTHIKEIDWLGSVLWIGIFVTLSLGCIFSGATWAWGSGPSIAVWTLLGVFLLCFFLQQYWCVLTTPERRAFPAYLLLNRAVSCTTLCAMCAAIGYGPTLYYTPIYFAFTRGHGALAAAVRLLPFIGAFIGTIFVAGGLLPAVRYYKVFFLVGPILMLVGGGLLQTISSQSSESRVMGFQAIVGLGLGTVWQLALPITSVVLPPQHRLDAVAIFNMAQTGGVAVSLMIAGAVYQNVGFDLVNAAVDGQGFTSHDIRELLSGTDSPVTAAHEPAMLAHTVDAVIETILRCYCLIIAAGAICLIGGCCMKLQALELRKKPEAQRQASEDREKRESL